MKILSELQEAVDAAAMAPVTAIAARRTLAMLDLTSLNATDTEADIHRLCARALTPAGRVAALCVWPRFVAQAHKSLVGTGVRVATVVNFPGGDENAEAVATDAAAARAAGADEIDVVLPYRAFIDGERKRPLDVLVACRKATGNGVMKVILETGAFPDADLLSWAARDALHAGADFLKTSTGKIPQGATLEAAALLLEAVRASGRDAGVKISGGVRDAATAAAYLALADTLCGGDWATSATFRFGASGLLDHVLETLGESVPMAACAAY